MSTSNSNDVLKELAQAWEQAQRQLAELRTRVEQTSVLAQAKFHGDALHQELDRAYRNLGEAVFEAVQQGALTIPPSMGHVFRALDEVQQRVHAHQASLVDLLKEGEEVADRLQKAKTHVSANSDVAPGAKKR